MATALAGIATPAGAQDDQPPVPASPEPPVSSAPSSTSTTVPVTVPVGDGEVVIAPPGADGPDAPESTPDAARSGNDDLPSVDGGDIDPSAPPDGATALPTLPTLPDPGPGVNATIAAIDIANAEDTLALVRDDLTASLPAVADALVDLAAAHDARRASIDARRAAEDTVRHRIEIVNVYSADLLVYGQPAPVAIEITDSSPDDLGRLVIGESVSGELQAQLAEARAALGTAADAEAAATQAIAPAEARVRSAETEVDRRRGEVVAAEAAVAAAREAAADARRSPAPPILGPAVVSAASLEAWYWRYYSAQPPVAPIADIIETYLRIGAEEGVAGDIAFAQAILETGGFRSGHARDANFAGIGAYDSCSPTCGFDFSGLDAGVRAHIHLLRAYADAGLTRADLAAPPHPLVAPERVWVRGCCPTWADLTGVWATDPNYDRKVLGIYRVMIETERARRAAP